MPETTLDPRPPPVVSDVFADSTREAPAWGLAVQRERRSPAELAELHAELRQRSLPILFWSALVFDTAYVAWTGFDLVLAPGFWRFFLTLRLIAAGVSAVLVIATHHSRFRKHTWEAFWVWLFIKGLFIALMLGVVDESSYTPYVMGFTLMLYGAGLLPYWHPRWAISNVATLVFALVPSFLLMGSRLTARELISTAFFVLTGAALAIVMAYFKYLQAERDYFRRAELATLIGRERHARMDLDHTSSALREALEQLKQIDRLKSQFFANISHELRTPLTLILAPVAELRRKPELGAHRGELAVVQRNAERLLRLIDDLLELSRLDAGGLRLSLTEVDLRSLVATVQDNAVPAATARQIKLELHGAPSANRIWGDAHRLEIVITNLLSNALKFTPDGGRIQLRIDEDARGIRLDVRDTGPGIAEDDLANVFERFYQVLRTDRRRNQGGVGIGLTLAKELVELHGGTLTVQSKLGQGSTFSAYFPFGKGHVRADVIERRRELHADAGPGRRGEDADSLPPSEPPISLSQPPPAAEVQRSESAPLLMRGRRRARVVVAEDQQELREFIAALLLPDYDVWTAADGDEAFDLAREQRPDLIISDVMMPGRTGTRLCRDVKADGELHATPVILLTARVGSEATLEGYANGADDFVAKPFHPRVLLARVRAQLLLRTLALELSERERLAAVGTMAAGILHEVRNPLNAILNAARVLSDDGVEPRVAKRLLLVVSDSAQRINDITQSLDTYARPSDVGGSAPSDVCEGLNATLLLLGHRLEGRHVVRDYKTTARALAPLGPLNQVFLNLLDNALNAGAESLRIVVEANGERLDVRVVDDGPGVPAQLKEHIFDPFVSGSNGTGLGLYLSRCIVERHGGALSVEPGPNGKGAAFLVSIPREMVA